MCSQLYIVVGGVGWDIYNKPKYFWNTKQE